MYNTKCSPQVKLSIYKAGVEVFYTVFNASDSTKESWISQDRIMTSSATDIKNEVLTPRSDFFTING